jgi:hypothetical protein
VTFVVSFPRDVMVTFLRVFVVSFPRDVTVTFLRDLRGEFSARRHGYFSS